MQSAAVTLAVQNIATQVASGRKAVMPKFPARWLYPHAVERDYAAAIVRQMEPFFKIVEEELLRYPQWVRADTRRDAFSDDWSTSMKRLRSYQRMVFEDQGRAHTATFVTRFATATDKYNEAQWAKHLSALAGSAHFPVPMTVAPATVETWENTNLELIRSLSDDYIKKVNATVVEAVGAGTSRTDLTKSIMKINSNISKARAQLIATDQIGKLNGALAGARQSDAGITDYTWQTSEDERVRSTHKHMDAKVCKWADGSVYKAAFASGARWRPRTSSMPVGAPGSEIRCRCYASPNMPGVWAEAEAEAEAQGWYDPQTKTKKGGK